MGAEAAADLGLAPADLRDLAAQPGDVPERMRRMSAVFSASEPFARLGRFEVLDMARACGACAERRACDHALHGKAAPTEEACAFCPNAEAYRALRRAAA
jgi:hypothetical protein